MLRRISTFCQSLKDIAFLMLLFGLSQTILAASKPNIIIILGDDIGYSDIGCYGGEIQTPNLDALAKNGVQFTQFYNGARCCPTRASLLTGLHPHQAGIGHMMDDRGLDGYRGQLNQQCVTIPEALKPSGYRSYMVGKWHVTPGMSAEAEERREQWPRKRGFDRFYGTIHGAGSYFDPSSLVRDDTIITAYADPEYPSENYYYTDALAHQASRFVREHTQSHTGEPFFLYLAFTAAHWPLHAKESDIAKYKGKYDEGYEAIHRARLQKQRERGLIEAQLPANPLPEKWDEVKDKTFEARCMEVYAAQIDSMDQGIGRLVATLKEVNQFENTLIFYLQDNGGCAESIGRGAKPQSETAGQALTAMKPTDRQHNSTPKQTRDGRPVRSGIGVLPGAADTYIAYGKGWASVSNTPFREYKHWTHEGGIATPLIAHWPSGISPQCRGKLERQPGQLVDLMATCLDIVGQSYPAKNNGTKIKPLQGTSLRPLLQAQEFSRKTPLFWEHEGNRAIRDGQWKLVAKENSPWELYDMESDRSELQNIAHQKPEMVAKLSATWDEWAKRSDVLPLGGWRASSKQAQRLNTQRSFGLKKGDHLERSKAPSLANRGFSVAGSFTLTDQAKGVVVAQGGRTHGFTVFFDQNRLRVLLRRQNDFLEVASEQLAAGKHTFAARFEAAGVLTLTVDDQIVATSTRPGFALTMPQEGLSVGEDEGASVGPYGSDNSFSGQIDQLELKLEPLPQ